MRYRSFVRSFEWIACLYFAYLIVACWWPPLTAGRRAFVVAAAALSGGAVWTIAGTAPTLVRAPGVVVGVGVTACIGLRRSTDSS